MQPRVRRIDAEQACCFLHRKLMQVTGHKNLPVDSSRSRISAGEPADLGSLNSILRSLVAFFGGVCQVMRMSAVQRNRFSASRIAIRYSQGLKSLPERNWSR